MTNGADWIAGVHAVSSALESGRPLDLIWIQKGRRDHRLQRIVNRARAHNVPVRFVPRVQLERLVGDGAHTGIAARVAPLAFASLESLIRPAPAPGRILLLDGVTDPHNAGAVIRSAAAFGVDGVVLAGRGVPPLGGALATASAGQLEHIAVARESVAGDALRRCRDSGYWAYGAAVGGTPLPEIEPPARWVLALGAEAAGLRAKTRANLDEVVSIPMRPGVESLNVSVAAAILAYALSGPDRSS